MNEPAKNIFYRRTLTLCTGCPRSNLAETLQGLIFDPMFIRSKCVLETYIFCGKFLIFEKLFTLSIKTGEWALIFNQAS